MKILVRSFGLLSLPLGAVVYMRKYSTDESKKHMDALDLMEKWAIQKQKTCVYFSGANTELSDLFTQRPNLVSNKIYINDDPNIAVGEILVQLRQLIDKNIHIDYVLIQNNHLKINPKILNLSNDFKTLLFSENGLYRRV